MDLAGRLGSNELISSVFGKLARMGTKNKASKRKKGKEDDFLPSSDSDDESVPLRTEEEIRNADDEKGPAESSFTSADPSGDYSDSDDDGYFIFDMRTQLQCYEASRGLCIWQEFNHMCSSLRYCITSNVPGHLLHVLSSSVSFQVRSLKINQVVDIFAQDKRTQGSGVLSASGGSLHVLASKLNAPQSYLRSILKYVEKTIGKHKAYSCLCIGTTVQKGYLWCASEVDSIDLHLRTDDRSRST